MMNTQFQNSSIMADPVQNGDIKENFVEDGIKVDVEATTINLDCVKSEPNEGTLDFEEDNHSTQYKITLKCEDIYGESSRQIKIEEDYDNLIGFLDNDVIMENAMIKLETVKEEKDDLSLNNFYCRNCKGIYKGYCLMCSTLLCILNNNTSIASFEAESNTIPTDILEIRTTSRGKGVYLLRTVPINVIFGPFEGILGTESTIGHSWKIIDNKLKNIKSGNWMKNVVCAASASLKNLDIFQIDGNLYFQTIREITEGKELLIYYDNGKLQQLDNSKECLYTPQKREKLPKIFACTVCCLGFGSNKCLVEHKKKCCRMKHSRSMDEFVLIECHYCKMWLEKWEHEEYHVAWCLEKHHRTCNNYSEGIDRSVADVEEMGEGDCGTRAGKRRYRGGDICSSRRKDRKDDLQFDQHLHNNLNKHRGGGGGIKRFKCDICLMKFTQKGGLKIHIIKKHTDDGGVKDYKCSHCSFQTNYKSNLGKHLNKHKGVKPFQCDICLMKFTEKRHLKMHIKNKHTDDGGVKDYRCVECSYETNDKANFQKHLNKHKGIKAFQCEICMKEFTQKSNLKTHIKNKHTDDATDKVYKVYKCSECPFETNDKRNLHRHLNKHKGIKPFQCDICVAKFTQKVHLNTHIKNKHTDDGGVKDYQCLECFYETNDKANFQKHLNKHKGIKPFQCEICLVKFTQKCNLKKHIKNIHTDDATDKGYK